MMLLKYFINDGTVYLTDEVTTLLAGSMNQPPSRSSSSRTQRNNQNRTPSNPNVGVPGADPMAAMLASLGGGTNPAAAAGLPALPAMPALPGGTGGSAKTLTSLMATMTGGVPSSNDMAALAAGLGGPNSGNSLFLIVPYKYNNLSKIKNYDFVCQCHIKVKVMSKLLSM